MKKVRKLSFLGILGVVIAVLFLISISFTQAQVKIQAKPDSPPGLDKKDPKEPEEEATWAVRIPTVWDTTLFGDGSDYIDGENNIEVTVEKNSPGAWRRDNDFVTSIVFKISNPTNRHVGFNFDVGDVKELTGEEFAFVEPDYGKPCCLFPPPYNYCQGCLCNDCEPLCLQDFMKSEFHPYTTNDDETTYRYFLIELHAFDKDILIMDIGESYLLGQYGHYHDYIEMTLRYQTQDREPTYHNIACSKSAHRGEDAIHPFNIWITRIGENTWTVDVGTSKEDPQILLLEEYYYETIQRGKNIKLAGWYSTLFASGKVHFTFDLIRTLPSS